MKHTRTLIEKVIFPLAILSVVSILFNLLATHLYKEQIFLERGSLSPVEYFIIIVLIFIIFFVISSLIWLLRITRKNGKFITGNFLILLFGLFCVLTLFAV